MIAISTRLSFELWRALTKLYLFDPPAHVYLIYDLIYELDKTNVILNVENGVSGYVILLLLVFVICFLFYRLKLFEMIFKKYIASLYNVIWRGCCES